ncbi:hypothetical protein BP6252_03566 [Coleophoma cylindrospora]|uniref:Uncharacterized protein n=1 Tax=Coleophoma cylindrospora TaxID=1849047 RepID=A0A3D8S8M6_9HELO|nr:hypothetical protein BP6252_03566 [Coleophoma cylindrospora]
MSQLNGSSMAAASTGKVRIQFGDLPFVEKTPYYSSQIGPSTSGNKIAASALNHPILAKKNSSPHPYTMPPTEFIPSSSRVSAFPVTPPPATMATLPPAPRAAINPLARAAHITSGTSSKWQNDFIAAKAEFQRIQKLVRFRGFVGSPFIPATFEEWLEHKFSLANVLREEDKDWGEALGEGVAAWVEALEDGEVDSQVEAEQENSDKSVSRKDGKKPATVATRTDTAKLQKKVNVEDWLSDDILASESNAQAEKTERTFLSTKITNLFGGRIMRSRGYGAVLIDETCFGPDSDRTNKFARFPTRRQLHDAGDSNVAEGFDRVFPAPVFIYRENEQQMLRKRYLLQIQPAYIPHSQSYGPLVAFTPTSDNLDYMSEQAHSGFYGSLTD